MPVKPRDAVKLVRENGGTFLRHGERHDLYLSPTGNIIPIPRHAKDLTIGVEKDIKRKLGL